MTLSLLNPSDSGEMINMQPKELKRKVGWVVPKNFRHSEEAKAAKAAAVKEGVATNTYMAVNPVTKKLEPLLLKANRKIRGEERDAIKKEYYSSNLSMSEIALKYDLTRNQVASACHTSVEVTDVLAHKIRTHAKTGESSWDKVVFESWEDRKKRRAKEKAKALANADRPQT